MEIQQEILDYNDSLEAGDSEICHILADWINSELHNSENKIWHRHPVWFLEGNPIVGYHKLKNCVRLMFWSGQSFDEPELKVEGKFYAGEKRYTAATELNEKDIRRWLRKSIEIQWDYKNIVKRKGVLIRLK